MLSSTSSRTPPQRQLPPWTRRGRPRTARVRATAERGWTATGMIRSMPRPRCCPGGCHRKRSLPSIRVSGCVGGWWRGWSFCVCGVVSMSWLRRYPAAWAHRPHALCPTPAASRHALTPPCPQWSAAAAPCCTARPVPSTASACSARRRRGSRRCGCVWSSTRCCSPLPARRPPGGAACWLGARLPAVHREGNCMPCWQAAPSLHAGWMLKSHRRVSLPSVPLQRAVAPAAPRPSAGPGGRACRCRQGGRCGAGTRGRRQAGCRAQLAQPHGAAAVR